ncbi:MAG: class I SAM-dependent methyltransferase [Proteobacteria bacterium]|nr:class I SAM-dependent methyltransferase [Pseudomonadota bacterium]
MPLFDKNAVSVPETAEQQEHLFDETYEKNANLQQQFNALLITQIVEYILQAIPTAKETPIRILDLCCGDGGATNDLANALEEKGILIDKIIGYDISPDQIKVASKYDDGKKRRFKVQDVIPQQNNIDDVNQCNCPEVEKNDEPENVSIAFYDKFFLFAGKANPAVSETIVTLSPQC